MKPDAAPQSWRDAHAREDGSYDAETWGEVDDDGYLLSDRPDEQEQALLDHTARYAAEQGADPYV